MFEVAGIGRAAIRAWTRSLGIVAPEAASGAEGGGLSMHLADPEGSTPELKGPSLH